jgi:hypothetical protein
MRAPGLASLGVEDGPTASQGAGCVAADDQDSDDLLSGLPGLGSDRVKYFLELRSNQIGAVAESLIHDGLCCC